MQDKMIFQIDEKNYPPYLLNKLFNRSNVKLVPLLDVAIAVKDSTSSKLGRNMNVFIRSRKQDKYYYEGEVWPG